MLYRPEAFEPLTDTGWNDVRVRDALHALVAETDAAMRGPKLLWRAHEWDRWHATSPMKNLYVGAAGVLWALDQLRRRGHAETSLDLAQLARRNLEAFQAKPDYIRDWAELPSPRDSSLLLGEAGILLVTWRLAPDDEIAEELLVRVRENVDNDAQEIMWGSPGSLLAAWQMFEWTNDERWRDAWNESADALLARRREDGHWTNRLYGQEFTSLTPPHGVVGIVQALVTLLDQARADGLRRDTARILTDAAVPEGDIANWPPRPGRDLVGPDSEIRVQWCAGSPGIVIGAADYLDEELLLAGAELPWRAGPPKDEKGPGICHGTAGNGYAFLKAFARTGDEQWLQRARRFAVHALEQVQRMPLRHSLWTGGIGVALYAADCLDQRTEYPFMEYA